MDEAAAHQGLEAEPGALSTVQGTCGQGACHPVIGARIHSSLMTTAVGLVGSSRPAFGEGATEQPMGALWADPRPSPADAYTRRLCGGCHLGTRRANRDDAIVTAGSGCSACHLASAAGHPVTVAQPEDRACAGCHSRSGRVSLGYAGWAERTDGTPCEDPLPWADGRTFCAQPADVHHAAGLDCVDCHTHNALMGSGRPARRQADEVEIRCQACHGASWPAAPFEPAEDAFLADRLPRKGITLDGPVRRGVRGTPLWNLRAVGDGWVLHRKADGAPFPVPATPEDVTHRQPGHERLSCQACHTPLIPTCAECHVRFDPAGEQWDFGPAAVVAGRWVESGDGFASAPPTLAVNGADRIVPAAPGMILTVDASAAGGQVTRRRWFGSFDPHTTQRQARRCEGCHQDPVALGLGAGALSWRDGEWVFTPAHPDPAAPGAGRDRWVTWAQTEPGRSLKAGVRSLDRAERDRVLTVGRCLACHRDGAAEPYRRWPEPLVRRDAPCVPMW
ncbi:MAG: hypothetical protein H6702_00065 [Myxococcales bacterium]|nr:hypothetical protein [Myxococcales bacterium]